MKSRYILAIAMFIQAINCHAQWNQTDGPYGNTDVLSIIPDDSIIFTLTNCGLFSKKTINNDWNLKNPHLFFSSYTKIKDSLFVVNNGIKLIDLLNPENSPTNISTLPFSTLTHSDSCIYGGGSPLGFYKSNNFGKTWIRHNTGLPIDTGSKPDPPYYYIIYDIKSVEMTSKYIFCGTTKGVYRNSEMLATWTPVNSGLPLSTVSFIKSFNDTLFVAIGNSLFKSLDFGNNWTLIFNSPSSITTVLKVNNQYLVGSSNNGIHYSIDNGKRWNTLNTGLPDLSITTLVYYDSMIICGTKSKGIFYNHNGQWITNKSGLICSNIKSLAKTKSGLVANDINNVYVSNNGTNWDSVNTPNIPKYPKLGSGIGSLATNGDTIYISYHYSTPGAPFSYSYIRYTKDNCNTWDELLTNLPYTLNGKLYKIYHENNRFFAYVDNKIYYTDNSGLNWINISLPSKYCNQIKAFVNYNSIPFIATCGDAQLLRLDSNQSWVLSNNGLPPNGKPISLVSCEGALFVYIQNYGMFVSFDNGNYWTFANNGLVTNISIRDFAYIGNNLFISSNYGVYFTNDFGQNWVSINNGLINLDLSSIKIMNDTLYVGTYGNGIWKRSLHEIPVNTQDPPQSDKSFIIYPNPASDYIHVANNSNAASFKIIDMIGKEVLSGNLEPQHEINISKIIDGAYIFLIHSGTKVQMMKFLINK